MHLPTLQTADGEIASPPAQLLDLLKIGLFPNEWIVTLRPTNTQFPIYGDMSGLGQTSLIVSHDRTRAFFIALAPADHTEYCTSESGCQGAMARHTGVVTGARLGSARPGAF